MYTVKKHPNCKIFTQSQWEWENWCTVCLPCYIFHLNWNARLCAAECPLDLSACITSEHSLLESFQPAVINVDGTDIFNVTS